MKRSSITLTLHLLSMVTFGCAENQPASTPADPAVESVSRALVPPTQGPFKADPALLKAIRVAEQAPSRADSWVVLGRRWVGIARQTQDETLYDQVDEAARRALKIDSRNAKAKHLRALVLRTHRDFFGLDALARQLVEANPQDNAAWALLADATLALGDMDRAETAIETLLNQAPGLPAYTRAAWFRWLNNDVEGALELWLEAARVAPSGENKAWCLSQIGDLEWHRGQFERAEQRYTAALVEMPDHADALLGRARARWGLAGTAIAPPAAIADLRASLKARPHELTFDWLAAALAATPEGDKIDKQLTAAGAFDDPRSIAAYLAVRGLRPAEAVRLAQVDARQRRDVQGLAVLGLAQSRAGHSAAATGTLAKALRHGTPDAFLYAASGINHRAAGRLEAATHDLQKSLDLNTHFHPVLAAEVRAILKKDQQ